MTENEAIQFLDNIKHEEAGRAIGKDGFYAELMGYHVEALNMAIKALETIPKYKDAYNKGFEDCRQAVFEQINCWIGSGEYRYTNATDYLNKRIKALQAVNPQEPTWVTGSDGAKIAFKDVPAWKVTKICEILADVVEAEEDQEPKGDALNKIRTKIEELADADGYGDYQLGFSFGLMMAMEIIDKHKAESDNCN